MMYNSSIVILLTILCWINCFSFCKNDCNIKPFDSLLRITGGRNITTEDGINIILVEDTKSVQFECPPGYELNGLKQLSCFGENFVSNIPYCYQIYCDAPQILENGYYHRYHTSNDSDVRRTGFYLLGTVLLAQCNDGYRLEHGSSAQMFCKRNESNLYWKGATPICETIPFCGDPGVSRNGKRFGKDFYEGSKVFYNCKPGFELVGERFIVCTNDGTWSSLRPKCKPDVICHDPDLILNGKFVSWSKEGDYFVPGDEVELVCDRGFRLTGGNDRAHCHLIDKQIESFEIDDENVSFLTGEPFWDEKFGQCDEIFCARPEIQENGYLINWNTQENISKADRFPFDFKIEYQCNAGYRLIGRKYNRCTFNGWSLKRTPLCKKIRCRPPIAPKNGFLVSEISREVGFRSKFECLVGFNLVGSRNRVCLHNGKWSGEEPKCLTDAFQCGVIGTESKNNQGIGRIFNGDIVEDAWPWMVALHLRYPLNRNKSFEFKCGGSLIRNNWVLTAGHCLKGRYHDLTEEDIHVELGHTNSNDKSHSMKLEASTIILHPNFGRKPFDSDLALIKLIKPVNFTREIRPICLPPAEIDIIPSSSLYKPSKMGTALGYGTFIPKSREMYHNLRSVELQIRNDEECYDSLKNTSLIMTENMFCAGGHLGRDTCMGDSGGPMMQSVTSVDGEVIWVQVGIVSWAKSEKCGVDGEFGFYTKISRFVPWIINMLDKF